MKFFLIFFVTNILFSFILFLFILKFARKHNYSKVEILLYSLGTGPAFTVLLLCYLLLVLPGSAYSGASRHSIPIEVAT